MATLQSLRERARRLKVEVFALYLAARHPRTPWYAKLVIAGCVAYAVTPADIIPDVLPIFGWVDDLLFIPIAVALAVRCVPQPVLAECRSRAHEVSAQASRPSPALWCAIAGAWIGLLAAAVLWNLD